MTNEELYKAVYEGDTITKEVTDILLELDRTSSSTTQAELNKLLTAIHERFNEGDLSIEELDPEHPVSKEKFIAWVDDNFDAYSAKMFHESID